MRAHPPWRTATPVPNTPAHHYRPPPVPSLLPTDNNKDHIALGLTPFSALTRHTFDQRHTTHTMTTLANDDIMLTTSPIDSTSPATSTPIKQPSYLFQMPLPRSELCSCELRLQKGQAHNALHEMHQDLRVHAHLFRPTSDLPPPNGDANAFGSRCMIFTPIVHYSAHERAQPPAHDHLDYHNPTVNASSPSHPVWQQTPCQKPRPVSPPPSLYPAPPTASGEEPRHSQTFTVTPLLHRPEPPPSHQRRHSRRYIIMGER